MNWEGNSGRLDEILHKPGQDWSQEDIQLVFEWLCQIMMRKIVCFAIGVFGAYGYIKDPELAEEVVQTKLVDALKYIASYDPRRYRGTKCPFLNWIYKLIKREVGSRVKEIRERPPFPTEPEAPSRPPTTPTDESQWLRYLSLLPAPYREAIELILFEGLTHQEAATKSSRPCTEAAMRVRFHRAKQELRRIIKERGDGHGA